jgi:hypothetical protein
MNRSACSQSFGPRKQADSVQIAGCIGLNDVIGPVRIHLTRNDLRGFAVSATGAACGLGVFLTVPGLVDDRRLRQRPVPGTSKARS